MRDPNPGGTSARTGHRSSGVRCADCSATQILLPTELTVPRADSTEAIGNALVAKAPGAGFRTIAAETGRPESTVRRWVRAAREPHSQWRTGAAWHAPRRVTGSCRSGRRRSGALSGTG